MLHHSFLSTEIIARRVQIARCSLLNFIQTIFPGLFGGYGGRLASGSANISHTFIGTGKPIFPWKQVSEIGNHYLVDAQPAEYDEHTNTLIQTHALISKPSRSRPHQFVRWTYMKIVRPFARRDIPVYRHYSSIVRKLLILEIITVLYEKGEESLQICSSPHTWLPWERQIAANRSGEIITIFLVRESAYVCMRAYLLNAFRKICVYLSVPRWAGQREIMRTEIHAEESTTLSKSYLILLIVYMLQKKDTVNEGRMKLYWIEVTRHPRCW